jgi:PAS domain-containing protein
VLASGIDALAGTVRYNKRLSTRLATTAAALAAMAVCAWAFEAAKAALAGFGLGAEAATMAALALVALLPFALSLLPLMSMTALRYGQPQAPLRWLADSNWMAAIYVASALIAGLVHLQAQRFGATTLVVTAVSALVILLLLRFAVQRQEAERQRQETQLAQAQHEATLNHQRFAAAFSHAAIGMVIVKPDGTMLQANDALCALLKLKPDEVLGDPSRCCWTAPTHHRCSAAPRPRGSRPMMPFRWSCRSGAATARRSGWPFTAASTRTRTAAGLA